MCAFCCQRIVPYTVGLYRGDLRTACDNEWHCKLRLLMAKKIIVMWVAEEAPRDDFCFEEDEIFRVMAAGGAFQRYNTTNIAASWIIRLLLNIPMTNHPTATVTPLLSTTMLTQGIIPFSEIFFLYLQATFLFTYTHKPVHNTIMSRCFDKSVQVRFRCCFRIPALKGT